MKKFLCCLLVLSSVAITAKAQARYLVQLKNKAATPYTLSNPITYLSQRSIDRRTRYHIALDSTDLPITPAYLDSIRAAPNVAILNVSKWMNQVSVQTSDSAALSKINSFSFVQKVAPIATQARQGNNTLPTKFNNTSGTVKEQEVTDNYYNYGSSLAQVDIHNGVFLHNIGLRGQGMVIGMLDAGYYNYTTLKAFDSVNANHQVLGTWDFVAREQSVVEDYPHGMQCFSTIAANIPGQFVGTAPKASFYLFRTEEAATENPIEEHNWVCGAERVDSAGGDVISSSLGYIDFDNAAFNHTYADLNGHTTIAALGAGLAAKKGILVLNAAGNSGDKPWKYLMTPADADSILAVGAVDAAGNIANFSSYGPTPDGRVKPDVLSVGSYAIIQATNNTIAGGYGTSYACPNMAGLATCLWQGFQEFNNIKIIDALRKAGSRYTTPDAHMGYGIPNVKRALLNLLKDYATVTATGANCATTLSWNSKDLAGMLYQVERKTATDTAFVKVGEVAGSGSVFANHSYQFTDSLKIAQSGATTYRIKQVIDTAAATYMADYIGSASTNASCVATAINNVNAEHKISIAPNPAATAFVLKVDEPLYIKNLKIVITDARGRTVSVLQKTKPAGAATFTIPVNQLASGQYFVAVYNNAQLLGSQVLIKL